MEEKKILKEKSRFIVNEMVLCYEPDPMKAKMLYDAKVLDIDLTKDEKGKKVCEYYIHFQGWNKSWDRWILEDQIMKDNENGRGAQAKLLKEAIKPKKRKRKITKSETTSDENKSATSHEVEEEIKVIQLPPVSLDIPKILANKIEDDCYNIKRRKKLIHLPRKPSVADILSDYYNHCKSISNKPEGKELSMTIIEELIDGLTTYFNFFLNTLLLYNFEREQYLKFFPTQKPPDHLISLHCATPPVTPLLSPKLSTIASTEKGVESKESSRSNSRSSSFSEDLPLAVSAKQTRGRRGRRKSNLSVEALENLDHGKRRRNESTSTNNTDKAMSPLSPAESGFFKPSPGAEVDASNSNTKRETRSSKTVTTRPNDVIIIKEEPKDGFDEPSKNDETECSSRLRRSSRVPKVALTTPVTTDTSMAVTTTTITTTAITAATTIASTMPDATLVVPATTKIEQEVSIDISKPLTVQTDTPTLPPFKSDNSFMMYPIRADNSTPIDIYGPEHLLRLFVKLPVLLASSNIEQPKLTVVLKYVTKLLEYLASRTELFTEAVYSESVL